YQRPQWTAAVLYTFALFTKVEAVGALGAFWAFDLWQRAREAPGVSLPLAVTAIYFIIRWRVMAPFPFDETRHAPDVGASQYLATQLTAWWYYVARWI